MIKLNAIITLKRVPELGLNDRIKSGLRPSFNHAGELVACVVESVDGSEWLEIGTQQHVTVSLPYGDQLGWQLPTGTDFLLNVGGRVVGKGTVFENPPPPTSDSPPP